MAEQVKANRMKNNGLFNPGLVSERGNQCSVFILS